MIWYLLYPLRGYVVTSSSGSPSAAGFLQLANIDLLYCRTTEAPVLATTHPIRSHFARYGRYAARHVVTTLLISAAVATTLIYPIPFLFTNDFINGASNLPHHVWTAAQPLAFDSPVEPDVIMRSIWVHGSYMRTLNKELLVAALELQDGLLGATVHFEPHHQHGSKPGLSEAEATTFEIQRDALHIVNGLTNSSWFFQSPLMYWNCSREDIMADPDILATVNDRKTQSTPENITLRHSIVFSGKRFEHRRILGADALVITLLHLRDSPLGRHWEQKLLELSDTASDTWDIYPSDGRVSLSQLYEFQFRPISLQDTMILGVAYSLGLLYFLISLSKIRAVKSKFGLIVTVMTQVGFSIMASFTICAIINIDLSRIPRVAYPLVIFSLSLENIFRLINAVILTPPEESTSSRIGDAFGATAHVALASTLQNAAILLGLSRVVSQGVSAFCIFAAIAIGFDFFFMSTFFLAVLSVDVRRTELSDALAKASQRQQRSLSEARGRHGWLWQALQGKTALSTRIAGTIIMIGFVLIAQWHFFDENSVFKSLIRLFRGIEVPEGLDLGETSSLLAKIHQARSPTSWLRLQDHETAREVIDLLKPSAYTYVARVYEPTVFVMKNADRTPSIKERTLLPAAYDFVHKQLPRFLVFIIVVVAALRLLTNFLLWEDESDLAEEYDVAEEPLLSVQSLKNGHMLDIAHLTSTSDGLLVSASLDRAIRVWDIRSGGLSYTVPIEAGEKLFPVLATAIDQRSRWLAILSPSQVNFWNLASRSWAQHVLVEIGSHRPEAFFFETSGSDDLYPPPLLVAHRDGGIRRLVPRTRASEGFSTNLGTLRLAQPLVLKGEDATQLPHLVALLPRSGDLHIARRLDQTWELSKPQLKGFTSREIVQVLAVQGLRLFLLATEACVYVTHGDSGVILHSINLKEPLQRRSLQSSHAVHRRSHAGMVGLNWFAISYVGAHSGDCVVQTLLPPEDQDAVFLFKPSGGSPQRKWCFWKDAKEAIKTVSNPGDWIVLPDGTTVGMRRQAPEESSVMDGKHLDKGDSIRNRFASRSSPRAKQWEFWTAPAGERSGWEEVRPLHNDPENAGHLLVPELGPVTKVGLTSVAFSFGNVIQLVTVGGHQRFEGDDDGGSLDPTATLKGRRRRAGGTMRPRTLS